MTVHTVVFVRLEVLSRSYKRRLKDNKVPDLADSQLRWFFWVV